jgi:hypothetical protein
MATNAGSDGHAELSEPIRHDPCRSLLFTRNLWIPMQVAPEVDQILPDGLDPMGKCDLELIDVLRAAGGWKEGEER